MGPLVQETDVCRLGENSPKQHPSTGIPRQQYIILVSVKEPVPAGLESPGLLCCPVPCNKTKEAQEYPCLVLFSLG